MRKLRSHIRNQMRRFRTNRRAPSALGLTECLFRQGVTARPRLWTAPCYPLGVRSERGYTLIEIMVVMGLIGVASAMAVPVFIESNARNRLWTASEQIGGAIRQTRLKAISQNTSYRVVFDCPSAGSVRSLILTGRPAGRRRCRSLRRDHGWRLGRHRNAAQRDVRPRFGNRPPGVRAGHLHGTRRLDSINHQRSIWFSYQNSRRQRHWPDHFQQHRVTSAASRSWKPSSPW